MTQELMFVTLLGQQLILGLISFTAIFFTGCVAEKEGVEWFKLVWWHAIPILTVITSAIVGVISYNFNMPAIVLLLAAVLVVVLVRDAYVLLKEIGTFRGIIISLAGVGIVGVIVLVILFPSKNLRDIITLIIPVSGMVGAFRILTYYMLRYEGIRMGLFSRWN